MARSSSACRNPKITLNHGSTTAGHSARRPPERNQPMQNTTDYDAITSRFYQLTEELSAGCDSDFDAAHDDLEREFQELRLLVTAFDGR
jgi:hypothetical protein